MILSCMPTVRFTAQLRRFFPGLDDTEVSGKTVADVIVELDRRYPGIRGYILDDQGALRQHVNIFVGESMVTDRGSLRDTVARDDCVSIFQALSGGSTA